MNKRKPNGHWHISSAYFDLRGKELKINRSKHAASAVDRAFAHMSRDDYGARTVQVYDDNVLHAEIVRTPRRAITTWKRDPTEGH